MTRFAWLIALALAGCVNIDIEAPAKTYYLLKDAGQANCQAAPANAALLIDVLNPVTFYNAPNLAYGRNAASRGYYQFAQWVERPSSRIGLLLRDRLRASCFYRQVALSGEGMSGDLQLAIKLLDIYHDTATPPGQARIVLDVQLIRRDSARLLAHETFAVSAPAARFDASGAAAGFNEALPRLLDALVTWLERQPRR